MSLPVTQQPTLHKGIVKQILSGDAIIVRGEPRGGPPEERTICLSNITSPRLARRPNTQFEGAQAQETKDEPWAWEAREFVRKRCIGKEVSFTVEYKVPGTGREYGIVYLGKDTTCENLTELLIQEGLVEVRRGGLKPGDENQQKLIQLEELAKAAGKGKWTETPDGTHIRGITWNIDDPRKFVDSFHNKPIDAVIEHVRDGCTVRAFLLPSFHYVTIMLSGIKCPMFKQEGPEPLSEQARYFTETRVLQRDVQVILEGVSNANLLGTVLHPNGNITEFLLKEGFARCVDWSIGIVTQGPEKLRAAEKIAKDARIRIWKDYTPPVSTVQTSDKVLDGKVVEIVNADAMVVKLPDGVYKKVFLSSIRPPRVESLAATSVDKEKKADPKTEPQKCTRPLYDVPYMFEAREFLRKKLIGKKVNVEVDYVQPASATFPERYCCTVTSAGTNVGEALISRGLATVVRYRQDDDQRSAHYDELMSAEARAQKKGVGLHSKKDPPIHRVADLSGDSAKSKQFLPFLQRAGRMEGLVEMVASGSRVRLFIPRETCLITLLMSGINCPRGARPQGNVMVPADPYGEEALKYTKELCLHREVEVEIEGTDKGGNFIGWLFADGENLSVSLVSKGLAQVHFTAERSRHYKTLLNAESKAKDEKLNIWKDFKETPTDTEIQKLDDASERKVNYKNVMVSEVKSDDLTFYVQYFDEGPQLETMMEELRTAMATNPPLLGVYTPRKGDLCAAKFVDGEWYRARVDRLVDGGDVHVFYIDYGNREITGPQNLATLPVQFTGISAKANEFSLACVTLPDDEESKLDAISAFTSDVVGKELRLNVEYRVQSREFATLQSVDDQDKAQDITLALITEGLLVVEERREKRLVKIVSEYRKAQEKAKRDRMNIWRYGDFRQDDAAEFGYKR